MDDVKKQFQDKKTFQVDGTTRNERMSLRVYPSLEQTQSLLRTQQQRRIGEASSTLFSRGRRSRTFFTEDSHRYITPQEKEDLQMRRYRYDRSFHFDSVQMRYSVAGQSSGEMLVQSLQTRYSHTLETLFSLPEMLRLHISPLRLWNASIVGAIFFGMFSMTLIYKYLGQQASAESEARIASAPPVAQSMQYVEAPEVLGVTTQSPDQVKKEPIIDVDRINKVVQKDAEQERFETEAKDLVKGYPIEAMLPYIFKQDRLTATYLIAIAKKESAWGKRVPVRNGQECFNYWGYRGIRDKMGTGGHTCFDSREDAVKTVAKRINTLVNEKKLNTPAKMIIWKCGSSCAGHGSESVRKWISDVDMYVQALK